MGTSVNVTFGKPRVGGGVYIAPLGTTLPTTAAASLGETFKDLGYISDAGLSNSIDMSSTDVKEWGGSIVLSTEDSKTVTYSFKLIEALNVEALKAVFGSNNVTGTLETGITVKTNSNPMTEMSWVIDMVLRGGKLQRIVIPNGKVTSIGEITYAGNDATGYELTVTCYPDSSGEAAYTYIASPAE